MDQRLQPDRRQDAERDVEGIQQAALDVRDVGQVEQQEHQRRPDHQQRQPLVASAPGEYHPRDAQQQRQAEAQPQAEWSGRLVSPLARPLGDGWIAKEDPGVVGEQRNGGDVGNGLCRQRPPPRPPPPPGQHRLVGAAVGVGTLDTVVTRTHDYSGTAW